MSKCIVNFSSCWVNDTNQLKFVKSDWLKVKITAGLIDTLLVSFLKEIFALDRLNFNFRLVQKSSVILVPPHGISIISAAFFIYFIIF